MYLVRCDYCNGMGDFDEPDAGWRFADGEYICHFCCLPVDEPIGFWVSETGESVCLSSSTYLPDCDKSESGNSGGAI